MRPTPAVLAILLSASLLWPGGLFAQAIPPVVSSTVPRLINVTGVLPTPADGQARADVEVLQLAIYADGSGGTPLWEEAQSVRLDDSGRFAVMLGATQSDGVPLEVFAPDGARWLGIRVVRPGEVEGARVRLVSVPYALRAADADTLGGLPASAYALAPPAAATTAPPVTPSAKEAVTPLAVLPGTANWLAKYVNTLDLGVSGIFDSGGLVGVNTGTPLDAFHVRFTNTNGGMTGLAVQNLGATATSYSGMLFYDHTGALGQFQGFNNATHEYRINNIATTSGTSDGSINFLIANVSRFLVTAAGNIGMGTLSPQRALHVSRNAPAVMLASSYGSGSTFNIFPFGSTFEGRRARGADGAPTAVQAGDLLASFVGVGYDSSTWKRTGAIDIVAAEQFQPGPGFGGTNIVFSTFPAGSPGSLLPRMIINDRGAVGINISGASPETTLEISNAIYDFGRPKPQILLRDVGNQDPGGPAYLAYQSTPAGIFNGDTLVSLSGSGIVPDVANGIDGGPRSGVTVGNSVLLNGVPPQAEIALRAAEDWNGQLRGTEIRFRTTLHGTFAVADRMTITGAGNVGVVGSLGIGTSTPLDKLQVNGDIRLGTSGSNGCVRNFGGGVIAGSCSSDVRFKTDIVPFASMLEPVTSLQPVHYTWRAAEFPDRHFGGDRTYGLIAQDAEHVLPDLVVTQADGYKAVDYSKLPLLTLQAVKELKAENDELKRRVVELERLFRGVLNGMGGARQ